jgi:hypothetical protein
MKYLIHNGTRSRSNRTLRANMPEHGGYKQYVLGHRLVTGRPIAVTEETLQANLSELREKESCGLVFVTDLHLAPVDLVTLSVGPLPAESPLPAPALDSAANDVPAGMKVEVRGEAPPPAEFTMPVEAPSAAFSYSPAEEEVSDKVVEAPAPKPSRRGR